MIDNIKGAKAPSSNGKYDWLSTIPVPKDEPVYKIPMNPDYKTKNQVYSTYPKAAKYYYTAYPKYMPYHTQKATEYLFNYNDPTQVNSFADALLTMGNPNMKGHTNNPIKNLFTDVWNVLYQGTLKPLGAGVRELVDPEWKEKHPRDMNPFAAAGLNLITNLGETMDALTFANSIKAIVLGDDGKLGGGDGGFKNVKASLFGDENGRKNYDAETGNVAIDFAIEMILDPGNWVTLGTKGLATNTAQEMAEKLTKEASQEVSDKVAKRIAKQAVTSFLTGDFDTMQEAMETIVKKYSKGKYLMPIKGFSKEDVVKQVGNILLAGKEFEANRILKSVRKGVTAYNNYEGLVAKAALTSTGVAPAWWMAKGGTDWIKNKNRSALQSHMQPYLRENNRFDLFKYDEVKESLEQYFEVNNIANVASGEAVHAPSEVKLMLRKSITADIEDIDTIIRTFGGDIPKLNEEMCKLIGLESNNAVSEYLEILTSIVKNDDEGFFDEFADGINKLKKKYEDTKTFANVRNRAEKLTSELDAMEIAINSINSLRLSPEMPLSKMEIAKLTDEVSKKEAMDYAKEYADFMRKKNAKSNFARESLEDVFEDYSNRFYKQKLSEQQANSTARTIAHNTTKYVENTLTPLVDYMNAVALETASNPELSKLFKEAAEWVDDYAYNVLREILQPEWSERVAKSLKSGNGVPMLSSAPRIEKILDKLEPVFDALTEEFHTLKLFVETENAPIDLLELNKKAVKAHGMLVDKLMSYVVKCPEGFSSEAKKVLKRSEIGNIRYLSIQADELLSNTDFVATMETIANRLNKHVDTNIYVPAMQEHLQMLATLDITKCTIEELDYVLTSVNMDVTSMLQSFAKHNVDIDQLFIRTGNKDGSSVIKEFIENIRDINVFEIEQEVISKELTGAVYAQKLEQAYTASILANNRYLVDIMEGIHTNTGMGRVINQFSEMNIEQASENTKPIIQFATSVKKQLEYMRPYYKLHQEVANLPIREPIKWHFLSSMQWLGQLDPKRVLDSFDYYFADILDRTEMLGYSKNMERPLDIEHLMSEEMLDNVRKIFGNNTNAAHTALFDTFQLEEIINNEPALRKEILKYKGRPVILYDIETSSLKHNQGVITQIGAKKYGESDISKGLDVWLNPNNPLDVPTDGALAAFFPDLPAEERLAAYKARQSAEGTLEEVDMIQKFINTLKEHKYPVLAGHNIKAFDNRFVYGKVSKYVREGKISEKDFKYLLSIPKMDTLAILREANGYTTISDAEKAYLRYTLKDYTETMLHNPVHKMIAPATFEFTENMRLFAESLTDLTKHNALSIDEQNFAKEAALLASDAKLVADSVTSDLQMIKEMNKSLSDNLLFAEHIADGSYQEAMIRFITENAAEVMESTGKQIGPLIESISKQLNMTKLNYGLLPDGMYTYGFKKEIDPGILGEWFDLKSMGSGINFTRELAAKMTSVGKALDRTVDRIKQPEKIIALQNEIKAAIEYIQLHYQDADALEQFLIGAKPLHAHNTSTSFYTALKYDKENPLQQWAVLSYLYNTNIIQSRFDKGTLLRDAIDSKVLNLLDSADIELYKLDVDFTKIDPLDAAFTALDLDNFKISNRYVDMDNWTSAIDSLAREKNAVDNLAKMFDDYNIAQNQTQLISNAVMPTQNLLDTIVTKLKTLEPDGQKEFLQKLNRHYDKVLEQKSLQVLTLSPQDLYNHMVCRAPYMTISLDALEEASPLELAVRQLVENAKSLEELGIDIHTEKGRMYISLNQKNKIDIIFDNEAKMSRYYVKGVEIIPPELKQLDFNIDDDINEALQKAIQSFDTQSLSMSRGSSLSLATKEKAIQLYNRLPDKVKENMVSFSTVTDDKRFGWYSYDYTNLGNIFSVTNFDEYANRSLISVLKNNADNVAVKTQTKLQYVQHFYDNGFSVNASGLNHLSQEQLGNYLSQNPDFVLTALIADKKRGFKAVAINPRTSNWYETAKRCNAIIMPAHTYTTMKAVINERVSNSVLKVLNKIMYTYKLGYLFKPATTIRNYVDSTLKTMFDTGGFFKVFQAQGQAYKFNKQVNEEMLAIINSSQLPLKKLLDAGVPVEKIKNILQYKESVFKTAAVKLLSDYEDTVGDILKLDFHRRYTKENIDFYFAHMNPSIDRETFDMITNFDKSVASAGMTAEMQKHLQSKSKYIKDGNPIWEGYKKLNDKLMTPMGFVERVNRLAEYMLLNDQGAYTTEIINRIVKTHFDYDDKTAFGKFMEYFIPFYSFTEKNLNYFLDTLMEKPHILTTIENGIKSAWQLDETDYEEYNTNKSLQNMMLSGAIQVNDKGLTIKPGFSFMDVLQLTTNPMSWVEKTWSPLQNLIGRTGVLSEGQSTALGIPSMVQTKWDKNTKSYVQVPSTFANQSPKDFLLENLPYVGTIKGAMEARDAVQKRTGTPTALTGMLGSVARWQERTPYTPKPRSWKPAYAFRENGQPSRYWTDNKFKQYRQRYSSGGSSRYYYNANRMYTPSKYFQKYNNSAYRPTLEAGRGYDPMNYTNNFNTKVRIYEKQYSKKGTSRMKNRMATTTSINLQYKINDWKYSR